MKKTMLAAWVLAAGAVHGQQAPGFITPQQAVATALEKNFDIRIAKLEANTSELLNTAGNAGMLPTLDANGSYAVDARATEQTFFSGEVRKADNADSHVLNAALSANWTIFDGMAMFATKQRLEALEAMGKVELRRQMEATVYNVLTTYYLAAQMKKALAVQRETMATSRERLQIAEAGLRVGSMGNLAVVQARLDQSADSTAILELAQQLNTALNRLNTLMGLSPTAPLDVAEEIPAAEQLDLDQLLEQARASNAELQLARQSELLTDISVKQLRGALFPRVDIYGNYGYYRSTSSVGFLQSNTALGPDYGVRLSAPIFHGGSRNKAMQAAKIAGEQSRAATGQAEQELERQLMDAWSLYQLAGQRVAMGQTDLEGVRTQVEVALESYRVGMITAVELRDVQQGLLDTENRLLLAQYEAKSAELQLRLLAGKLL